MVCLIYLNAVKTLRRCIPSKGQLQGMATISQHNDSIMKKHDNDVVSLHGIQAARERIKSFIHHTPMMTCSYLNQLSGKNLFFKCENFQKTGSFKMRGAVNTLLRLREELGDIPFSVVTHSSGNHGQALALASRLLNISGNVVMPDIAPNSKKEAVRVYGAILHESLSTEKGRFEKCQEVLEKLGPSGEYVPSADHPFIMEGQGTIALEMIEDCPDMDAVVIACSTGGLVSGNAIAFKQLRPDIKVFACEPAKADDLAQSFAAGERISLTEYPDTIADGLRMSVGKKTWPIIKQLVERSLLVSEEEIINAMFLIWQRMKLVVEPSGAVPLAAVLSEEFQTLSKDFQNVGVILCGGNTDLNRLVLCNRHLLAEMVPSVIQHAGSIIQKHEEDKINLKGIQAARERIKSFIHHTPMMTCSYLDQLSGKNLFFKCENFQKTGSFKIRGALNALHRLQEQKAGEPLVPVTHSSGNHGQALAYAAQIHGLKASVIVPDVSPQSKRDAIEGYGGDIYISESTAEGRVRKCQEVLEKLGQSGEYVPSADHPFIMEGQGSLGLEMLEDTPELDAVVIACSSGGMISGTATALKALKPGIKVFACKPSKADDLVRSFAAGERMSLSSYPDTIADGLRMSVGKHTWPVIKENVESCILVSDEEIIDAMFLIWQRMKLVVEPSGAVPLAAVLSEEFRALSKDFKNVGLILCGGNTDLYKIPWLKT